MTEERTAEEKIRAEFAQLVSSPGFKHIEKIFEDEIADLQSIRNLDISSPEKMVADVALRTNLIDSLMAIFAKIKGEATAAQYDKTAEDEDIYVRS
jgi:hypothetical protein